MENNLDRPTTGRTYLLANGSSGHWYIDVDETPDGDEWTLQIENPQTYLVFRLVELDVIRKAISFLQSGLCAEQGRCYSASASGEGDFPLGQFGTASVSLRWDDEEGFRRCFLMISHQPHSTLHLSLYEADIQMIVEALQQVVADLPQSGAAPNRKPGSEASTKQLEESKNG